VNQVILSFEAFFAMSTTTKMKPPKEAEMVTRLLSDPTLIPGVMAKSKGTEVIRAMLKEAR
jgi:hypothetical protein